MCATSNPAIDLRVSGETLYGPPKWIFAVPGRSLAVAVTFENPGEYFGAPVQLLYSHILPAISR